MLESMDEIEKIKWEKSLVFLGNIQHSKVLQTLSFSDLFVSISTKESYGMAVAEACSTGVPVLALDTGDISDWVKQNYNGFIFPQEDSQGLKDKLNQIIKDLDLLTNMVYGSPYDDLSKLEKFIIVRFVDLKN